MREVYENGGWIQTRSGRRVWPLKPYLNKDQDFDIEDIVHSLSQQCRWTGHTESFTSVAQHCVMVSAIVKYHFGGDASAQYSALMHDCSEAYLCDLAAPIKQFFPNYKEWEEALMHRLADVFKFQWPATSIVKQADIAAAAIEWRDCMGPPMDETNTARLMDDKPWAELWDLSGDKKVGSITFSFSMSRGVSAVGWANAFMNRFNLLREELNIR